MYPQQLAPSIQIRGSFWLFFLLISIVVLEHFPEPSQHKIANNYTHYLSIGLKNLIIISSPKPNCLDKRGWEWNHCDAVDVCFSSVGFRKKKQALCSSKELQFASVVVLELVLVWSSEWILLTLFSKVDSLLSWCQSCKKEAKEKETLIFFMLEYNISLKFFLCHKMHAKNLKIFNVFLFSKADDKALFCSFFSSLFGRWEAWQCSREWRFPWQKVAWNVK